FGSGLHQAEVSVVAVAEHEGGLRALKGREPFLQFDTGWNRARDSPRCPGSHSIAPERSDRRFRDLGMGGEIQIIVGREQQDLMSLKVDFRQWRRVDRAKLPKKRPSCE